MKLIYPSTEHRSVNGIQLCEFREKAGLSQVELADLCFCSQQFISKIERPGWHEIDVAIAECLVAVLRSYK